MGFAVISKCRIEFPDGTPNTIFHTVTELLKANENFYHIENHPREIYFEISGNKGIDYEGVKEIRDKALAQLKNWGCTREGFIINCSEYTEALDGYYFEFSDVAHWFDNYLEESDRELLHRELDLKIAYPAHFDDLIAEDQAKVKQAKQKETDKEYCRCGHAEEHHNQKDGCTFQYLPDSEADYKDNQGFCVCTEFVQTKSIVCDVCGNSFDYEVWQKVKGNERPADELPDGYLISGKWVCDGCGSCSECGKSLEKEGNMFEKLDNKLCRDCKEEKE